MDSPSMADWTSAAPAQMTDAQYGKFSSNAYNWVRYSRNNLLDF
jgi:hypothetical protein